MQATHTLLNGGTLAGDWILDPRKSSIRLRTRFLGFVPVTGVFRRLSGYGTVDPDGEVSGTVTVAAASIDTGIRRRDKHLRSADFLDSGNNPEIIFTAYGIRSSDLGVTVTGALTVRGRTRPLPFDAAASVLGDGEIWLDAEVRVNRAEFGLAWNLLGTTSMDNTLTIHAVFTRGGDR